jgi:hypothetical protein
MSKTSTSIEQLGALRRCCDIYGADAARWPKAERAALSGILGTDEAALIMSEAQALDGFLNAASAPRMSEDLTRRIVASYTAPKAPAGVLDFLRGLAPAMRLVPAGALAGLGALGVASGMISASAQTPMTPEYEALAYLDDLSLTALDEQGDLTWDAE